MTTQDQVEICADPHELAMRAADWIVHLMSETNGRFRIALAGGSTPRELYTTLGSERYRGVVDWDQVECFWGDERFVPATDASNNYRMAHDTLLSHIPIPAQNIHPIPTDGTPEDAAQRYEATLKRIHEAEDLDPARPFFDLVLLGLGADGHTASLLPGTPVLEERTRWVAAVPKGMPQPRITLTYPIIESSRVVAILATGADKAAAVRGVRAGDLTLPAARLRPQGQLVWFLDRAAAPDT